MEHHANPIRLARCSHGTYFLSIDHTTVGLTQDQLISIARAIYGMAEQQRPLFVALVAGIRAEQLRLEAECGFPASKN